MLRRFLLAAVGLLALTTGALLLQAAQPTPSEPAKKSSKDDDSAKVRDKLSLEEQVLANRFKEFELKLLKLKQRLEHSSRQEDRERAVILQKALEKARDAAIGTRFEQMVEYLKTQRLSNVQDLQTAKKRSEELADDLRALLALLREDSRSAKLKEERKRIEEMLKEIKRLQDEEKRIQGMTRLGKTDPREVKGAQARNANDTNKLAKEMAKGSDGKSGDKNNKGEVKDAGKGKAAKGDAKDAGKSAEARAGKGKDAGKSSDGTQAEAKAGQGDSAQQAKAGQAKDGGQKGGQSQSAQAKTGDQKAGQAGAKAGQPKHGQTAQAKAGDPKTSTQAASKKGGSQANQGGKSGQQAQAKAGGNKGSQSQAKAGQGSKSGQASQSKSGGQQSQQAQAKSGSSSSGQAQSKSGQQGQQAKNKGDNSPPPQQAQNDLSRAQKRVREAYEKERSAEDNIGKRNDQAVKDEDEAIRKLDEARKRLEQLLRQLREEELERLLADLMARCQKMLRMQIHVYEGTLAVHKAIESNADKKANRQNKQDSLKLSDEEKAIVLEASKAIQILEEEGSAVAFPEVFVQVREDMRNVQKRLEIVDTGKITQATEEDIISTLRDMIKALEKSQKQLAQNKGGKGGSSGPQDQKLLDQIAELKMIRAMQIRVNQRTKLYGQQYEGEQANDPNLRREIQGLAQRQERIFEVTNRIVREENR
jgi:hypothetical protein